MFKTTTKTTDEIETGCKICGGCVRPEDFDLGLCLDCDEEDEEIHAERAAERLAQIDSGARCEEIQMDANETVKCSWCEAEADKSAALWLGDEAQHVCRPCLDQVEAQARAAEDAYYRSEEAAADFWEGVPVGPEGEALF